MKALGSFEVFSVKVTKEHHMVTIDEDGTIKIVLTDEGGKPKLNSEGKRIYIRGETPNALQGRTFKVSSDNVTIFRVRVLEPKNIPILDNKDLHPKLREARQPWVILKIKYDSKDTEDLMSYNNIMTHLHYNEIEGKVQVWQFQKIICHQGPLKRSDPNYNGSLYNVQVEWENGKITYVPLNLMIKDDKVTMAQYALDNDMIDT